MPVPHNLVSACPQPIDVGHKFCSFEAFNGLDQFGFARFECSQSSFELDDGKYKIVKRTESHS